MKKSRLFISVMCSVGLFGSAFELNAADSSVADPSAMGSDSGDQGAAAPHGKKHHAKKHRSAASKAKRAAKRAAKRSAKKASHMKHQSAQVADRDMDSQ